MQARNRSASRWAVIFTLAWLVPLVLVEELVLDLQPMTAATIVLITGGITGFIGSWFGARRFDTHHDTRAT